MSKVNREEIRQTIKNVLKQAESELVCLSALDDKSRGEQEWLELESEREKRDLENKDLKQNINIRRRFSWAIFYFLAIWSALIFILLFMNGLCWINLSDQVIITLLSSTTINIIGLFLVVVKYFFPSSSK